MTKMTLHPVMCAGQRIVRLPVVIEPPAFPSRGPMTQGAIVPEAVLVVAVLMTGGAFSGRIPEGRRAVTDLAKHKAMQTDQRKAGLVMIEINLLPPAALIVAGIAFGALLALMRIVLFVAGEAGRRQLLAIKVPLVARVTLGLRMLAQEGELRLPVMVEMDDVPFLRTMAVIAFGPIAPAVHVLQLMTNRAICTDALIALANVTGLAGDLLVCPGQRE